MKSFLAVWLAALAVTGFRMPKGRDLYFIENNLVYRRFLELDRNGTYRLINKDRTSCNEVDQGTWEQAADGTLRVHSVHHALRFRALLVGPLSVVLDSQAKIDVLPAAAAAIRLFLDSTSDKVFRPDTLDEFSTPSAPVSIDPHVETYRRDDLASLLRQIDDTALAERTGTHVFTPLKLPDIPPLLILQDAMFQASELARVRAEYHVPANAAPPFYFARSDARTFAREVGTWTALNPPTGPE